MLKYVQVLLLMLSLISCTSTRKQESTGEYVDDSVITSKVKGAVFNESSLKSLQINVKTFKGVVQLSGFVDSQDNYKRAGELAARVEGVHDVKNDLIVK